MDFKPVILWTDALIYILVALVLAFAVYARRREHLRAPWAQVIRGRLSMAALVILSAYLAIGFLDSLHFRQALPPAENDTSGETHYSVEVLSVFDLMGTPIRERVEKTYSAPLAAHLYAKEMITLPDGTPARAYPRLEYGGSHLTDPDSERWTDIAMVTAKGLVSGVMAWAIFVAFWIAWMSRRHAVGPSAFLSEVFGGRTEIPWNVFLYSVGLIFVLAGLVILVGPQYHILGTDKVGQDVLYQSLKSIRTGLVIGTLATLVMLPFAIWLGIMAGYFRGWVDDVIQYIYTTLNSIPGVLLIAAAILSLQIFMANHPEWFETIAARADIRLLFLCVILGITNWTGLCRLLRGETLKLREMDYLKASVALGVSHAKIITRHILPNVMHIVMIAVVLDFSALVLAEAVLSYVGVGVDPSMMSWGNMINSARLEMAREPMVWWSLLAAFIFMFGLVLSANLFSDAVRDAYDPRLRK